MKSLPSGIGYPQALEPSESRGGRGHRWAAPDHCGAAVHRFVGGELWRARAASGRREERRGGKRGVAEWGVGGGLYAEGQAKAETNL